MTSLSHRRTSCVGIDSIRIIHGVLRPASDVRFRYSRGLNSAVMIAAMDFECFGAYYNRRIVVEGSMPDVDLDRWQGFRIAMIRTRQGQVADAR